MEGVGVVRGAILTQLPKPRGGCVFQSNLRIGSTHGASGAVAQPAIIASHRGCESFNPLLPPAAPAVQSNKVYLPREASCVRRLAKDGHQIDEQSLWNEVSEATASYLSVGSDA